MQKMNKKRKLNCIETARQSHKIKQHDLYKVLMKELIIPEVLIIVICEYILKVKEIYVNQFGTYGVIEGQFRYPSEITIILKKLSTLQSDPHCDRRVRATKN